MTFCLNRVLGGVLLVGMMMAAPALAGQAPAGAPPSPSVPPAAPAEPSTIKLPPSGAASAPAEIPAGTTVPADYVIGPDDVLVVIFWREKELSSEVLVRPDGRITIPVLQDVEAAGLTPDQLRIKLTAQAEKYVEDPNVTVVVKQINSRRVFITGQVNKPGPYPLTAPITVVQLLSMAGGLLEYADAKNIAIMRMENGEAVSYRFNYREVADRKNLKQNILLKPGDTVIVP